MNYWLLLVTFVAVNLDFFIIMLFLLHRYRTVDVMVGYLVGVVILMTLSFTIGKALALFLPEWILGLLGFLPIYMALHDKDEAAQQTDRAPILATLTTYLAVCTGCNLSIFLPVLTGMTFSHFAMALIFIGALAVAVVWLIRAIGELPVVKRALTRYGEILMKVIYIGVGLYVFYDSGLITHLLNLV
ncbi:cadmium resistance transporter [Limosilactobacillus avium]|jgi:cadmium resistance protein CadD (predicted permease)|uniref:cadmium resistance transporter n=1 Tax=Limosilactobacillus avium TaxID=2991831 RepID=UPI0024BAA677|nr:cadmium resistance transporter [Limosilactobacillus avium]